MNYLKANKPQSRSGQAMVEFAIISFVLTAMLAGFLGIIVMGLGSFQNNIAAESAGRLLDEHAALSRNDLSTPRDVYQELKNTSPSPVYDEAFLIISRSKWYNSTFRSNLPELNLMLLGSYIFDPDVIPDGESEAGAFRYPGAVVRNGDNEQTVLIPLLKDAQLAPNRGTERAYSLSLDAHPLSDDWVAPVTIASTDIEGTYKVVIFYPSQPSSMLNLEIVRDGDGRIVSQTPVEADDSAITLSALPAGYTFDTPPINPDVDASTSRGQYGLGETFAFLKAVRPYRRVFESASVFRLAE